MEWMQDTQVPFAWRCHGPGFRSMSKLRRQMERAMEQAYDQALSFQRACVFAGAATLGQGRAVS